MLKANKKTLILTSILTILPIFVGVFFWNRLPDVMATHFGFDNEANGFSSKAFSVFGIPLILLVLEWVMALVTSQDPRKQNISPKIFTLALWIIPIVSLYCAAFIYAYNLGYKLDITTFSGLFMGMLFIIVGNYLPKARQNYTIGIRIPWTLANEENWNRTHRLGGYVWVLCGISMVVMTLCGAANTGLFAVLIPAVFIPMVYSFWLHVSRGL